VTEQRLEPGATWTITLNDTLDVEAGAYEAVALDHIARYVDRYAHEVPVKVERPHCMEPAVPWCRVT